MLSLESGQTYQNLLPGPTGTQITGSLVTDTDVYIGTNLDGVWKITLSEILSIAENASGISVVMYPNAFRTDSYIVIDNNLAAEQPEFIVTDISGKTIQKQILTQSKTLFNGEQLNAGIYFYTVQTKSGNSASGKFIIY
jgi:hypothetical protein